MLTLTVARSAAWRSSDDVGSVSSSSVSICPPDGRSAPAETATRGIARHGELCRESSRRDGAPGPALGRPHDGAGATGGGRSRRGPPCSVSSPPRRPRRPAARRPTALRSPRTRSPSLFRRGELSVQPLERQLPHLQVERDVLRLKLYPGGPGRLGRRRRSRPGVHWLPCAAGRQRDRRSREPNVKADTHRRSLAPSHASATEVEYGLRR